PPTTTVTMLTATRHRSPGTAGPAPPAAPARPTTACARPTAPATVPTNPMRHHPRQSSRMHAMAESATQTIPIEAPAVHCFAIATDFERYPEWAHDVKEAVVLERDDLGRGTEVEFRASALGRSTHYTLHYDYSDAPERLAWKLVRGDIMRGCDGSYQFTASAADPGVTEVTYTLSIELVVPLPGFVKRRAPVPILNTLTH